MPPNGSIRMSDAEITTACRRLGLPRPPTLPNHALPDDALPNDALPNDAPANQAPEIATSPSTIDHVPSASSTEVAEDLLRTLGRPETVVFAHRQDMDAAAEIRIFAVAGSWVVEQAPEPRSTYALCLFPADEAVARVAAFCRLEERDRADAQDCQMAGSTWLQVVDRAAIDPEGSVQLLRADGMASGEARAVAAALAACRLMAQVTVLQHPMAARLVGTTTSWFDAGTVGLWRVDAPKLARYGDHGEYGETLLEQALVTIGPVTREALIAEIRRGFPTAGLS